MQQYFAEIERRVRTAYSIAEEARSKGLDPVSIVEIPIATSLAERVTGLVAARHPQINDQRIVKRIKELEKESGIQDPVVAFKIAEEVALENGRMLVTNKLIMQDSYGVVKAWYWYLAGGEFISNYYLQQAQLMWDALRGKELEGALIRVSARGEDLRVEEKAKSFIRESIIELEEAL